MTQEEDEESGAQVRGPKLCRSRRSALHQSRAPNPRVAAACAWIGPGSVEFKKEDEPAPAEVLAIEEPVEVKTPEKKKKREILKKTEMDVVSILDDANRIKDADRKREEAEVKHRAARAKVLALSKAALAAMISKLSEDKGHMAVGCKAK